MNISAFMWTVKLYFLTFHQATAVAAAGFTCTQYMTPSPPLTHQPLGRKQTKF